MNRRKFLTGAAGACAAVALPAVALGLALKKPAEEMLTFSFDYDTNDGPAPIDPNWGIDGFHLEEGERLLITGAANPQSNGVYEVTKSSLAEAAMKAQPDLYEGIAEELLKPNRLFEQLPFKANDAHLVYDRQIEVTNWRRPEFPVDENELLSKRNKTVEVKNDLKFYDVNAFLPISNSP